MNQSVSNHVEYSVSEISGAVKQLVENEFSYIRVRGELGRVSRPQSGHIYLDLKDEKAVLAGVIWKGVASKLPLQPEQGLEVICTGKLTTFPGQSRYQLVIDHMEPAGEGALMALLETRKRQFAAEGLFDDARKKPLPYLPETIGVITSPSGAVIRDILHRLQDRFPRHVIVWPVRVQGETCAQEVARAIAGFNAAPQGTLPRPDIIIIARGGGSIEDLWPFNEDVIIRTAAASDIPLISAIGHETDTSLLDYVADLRAPTPTAAAEFAVPVRAELQAASAQFSTRLTSAQTRFITRQKERLFGLARALPTRSDLLAIPMQKRDTLAHRLFSGLKQALMMHRAKFARFEHHLHPTHVQQNITRHQEAVEKLHSHLQSTLKTHITQKQTALAHLGKQLDLLSHESVLQRGFALVLDEDEKPIRHARDTKPDARISIHLAKGEKLAARIETKHNPKKHIKAAQPDDRQAKLL